MVEDLNVTIQLLDGTVAAENVAVSIEFASESRRRSWQGSLDAELPPGEYLLVAGDGRRGRIVVDEMVGFFQGEGDFPRADDC